MFRRLMIVVAAAILVALGLSPTSAQAWPRCDSGYECWYDWYSDTTHTTLIGWMHVNCDGDQTSAGDRSPYLSFSSWPC